MQTSFGVRRRRQWFAAACAFAMVGGVAVSSSVGHEASAAGGPIAAVSDSSVTGTGIPVTVDVLANDELPAAVDRIELGTVSGASTATVTVNPDHTITFVNDNPNFPNGPSATMYKEATLTVPYTVYDVDGGSSSATLSVLIAGHIVTPGFRTFELLNSTIGPVQLKLSMSSSYYPGYGWRVVDIVSASHTSGFLASDGNFMVQAEPAGFAGNDIVTLLLEDAWGRQSQYRTDIGWLRVKPVTTTKVKTGVDMPIVIDLDALNDQYGFTSIEGHFSTNQPVDVLNGTLRLVGPGRQYEFTPTPGFVGAATSARGPYLSYYYLASNPLQGGVGQNTSEWRNEVWVDVQAPPVARAVNAQTTPGVAVDMNARTGATLPWANSTLSIASNPALGTVEIVGNVLRYTPNANAVAPGSGSGTDTFQFAWTDDVGQVSVATATVTILAGPGAPDHDATTAAEVPVTVDVMDGVSGDGVTLVGVGDGLFGTAAIVGGKVVYTPGDGFVGSDSVTYTVRDVRGTEASATVRIRVMAQAQILDSEYRTPKETPISFNPMVTASSEDADPDLAEFIPGIALVGLSDPSHGTVSIDADGVATYTPEPGFVGDDVMTVSAVDPLGRSYSATVTIHVLDDVVVPTPDPTDPVDPVDPDPTDPAVPDPEPSVVPSETAAGAGGADDGSGGGTQGGGVSGGAALPSAVAAPRLPETGSDSLGLLIVAAMALGVGGVVVVARRRVRA